ncbi:MAG: TFIIB-type zinc ribbon-containing protein [Clostridiales bacterium]|nr:TFIIB-type zinc ribbon-containing protein [Clostridiales bacterium]
MVTQYKCSNCGDNMVYDTISGALKCHSCGREDNIEQMARQHNLDDSLDGMNKEDKEAALKSFNKDYSDPFNEDEPSSHSTFVEDEVAEYNCNNCGANIITDKQTTATKCSFCGAAVVLSDRLTGNLAPSYVIPFMISKSQAQEAFKKWCKKGLLTPNDFRVADRIKDITGLYVPFWLFDLNGKGEVKATCTRVRTYTRGDWIYTETKYYHVYRKVDLNYKRIPCDASKKMDDKMMDRLEPYSYARLNSFEMPYLAGYIAEKYDFTDQELLPRVKTRANSYIDSYIRSTITGYSSVQINSKNINIRNRKADYTLLPVWLVCYDYNQAEHNFVMNGQTGKIIGRPPISRAKIATWLLGISGLSFLLLRLITFFLGGDFLW